MCLFGLLATAGPLLRLGSSRPVSCRWLDDEIKRRFDRSVVASELVHGPDAVADACCLKEATLEALTVESPRSTVEYKPQT